MLILETQMPHYEETQVVTQKDHLRVFQLRIQVTASSNSHVTGMS